MHWGSVISHRVCLFLLPAGGTLTCQHFQGLWGPRKWCQKTSWLDNAPKTTLINSKQLTPLQQDHFLTLVLWENETHLVQRLHWEVNHSSCLWEEGRWKTHFFLTSVNSTAEFYCFLSTACFYLFILPHLKKSTICHCTMYSEPSCVTIGDGLSNSHGIMWLSSWAGTQIQALPQSNYIHN